MGGANVSSMQYALICYDLQLILALMGAKGKVLVTDQLSRPAALAQDALPLIALAPAMTSS